MRTICLCAVSECMYFCATHVLAFSISLNAWAQGVSVQVLYTCFCPGFVWLVEVMAVCTVSTWCKYMVLFAAAADGRESPICMAERTLKILAKYSDNFSFQPSFWLQLLNSVWETVLHSM